MWNVSIESLKVNTLTCKEWLKFFTFRHNTNFSVHLWDLMSRTQSAVHKVLHGSKRIFFFFRGLSRGNLEDYPGTNRFPLWLCASCVKHTEVCESCALPLCHCCAPPWLFYSFLSSPAEPYCEEKSPAKLGHHLVSSVQRVANLDRAVNHLQL